jgi:pSer/pThr/pTyr-binding forkhead associated (FHA) protein
MSATRRPSQVVGQTKELGGERRASEVAVPQIKPVDRGMPRPWRIALTLMDLQVQLVFDLTQTVLIGRAYPDSESVPDIDLTPFNAEDLGVSRQHMNLMLQDDRVVMVDLGSVNGSYLNGQRLEPEKSYPIRNGDEIELGMMKIKAELLMNPFEVAH